MKKEKKIKAKNNSNKKKNDIRKIKPVDVVFELIDEPKKSKNKEIRRKMIEKQKNTKFSA